MTKPAFVLVKRFPPFVFSSLDTLDQQRGCSQKYQNHGTSKNSLHEILLLSASFYDEQFTCETVMNVRSFFQQLNHDVQKNRTQNTDHRSELYPSDHSCTHNYFFVSLMTMKTIIATASRQLAG
jgi:hypothetical protein